MAKTSGRIAISRNLGQMLDLAVKVYGKHVADGNASQLKVLEGDPWTKVGPTIAPALAKHNEAEALKGKMEAAYRERDLLTPAIDAALKSSRNLLKALNTSNPKRLAEWGFDVDDTAKAPKKPKA
jgi:hypothetical protein